MLIAFPHRFDSRQEQVFLPETITLRRRQLTTACKLEKGAWSFVDDIEQKLEELTNTVDDVTKDQVSMNWSLNF